MRGRNTANLLQCLRWRSGDDAMGTRERQKELQAGGYLCMNHA